MRILIAAVPLLALATVAANAADLPKRKAGLWEVTMENPAMAAAGMAKMTSKQCIDDATDAKLQQMGQGAADCKMGELKRSGQNFSMDSTCNIAGTKATSQMTGTGDFDSAYTMNVKVQYAPPLNGMSESAMKLDAKYLGACTPDMKPGDMTMPNGMKMNVNDMGGAMAPRPAK